MSTIWYPADPPSAGSLPGLYTDSAVAKDGAFYNNFSWPTLWESVIAACVTCAYTNVPVASGTNRFPVIVHSHGFSGDRTYNSQVAVELASHGYIVAAVDHVDCHCTVYPDARGARYMAPGSFPADSALARSRTNDIEYLLGALAQFDSADSVLAGRLDLNSIGAMGYSWGGGTMGEICRTDSRVKCAALLDPAIFTENGPHLVVVGLQKPFLTMNDTVPIHQSITPTPGQFSDISSNLFYLATTNATWLKVANASHTTFADPAWSMDMTSNTRSAALAIDAGTLWFFDTYLKGQTPPFPTNAEIINVQRK
jgi:dienelactone hydrolase